MGFFEKFNELCLEHGVSKTTVVDRCGISKSAVTRWKNGEDPNESSIFKIANYFGVDPKIMIGNSITFGNNPVVLTTEDASLLNAWHSATEEQKENIAFILRNYGFTYDSLTNKKVM